MAAKSVALVHTVKYITIFITYFTSLIII